MAERRTKQRALGEAPVEHGENARARPVAQLFNISKLLTRFDSVERTVPEVVAIVAETLPIRSAIVIVDMRGVCDTICWQPEGEDAEQLREAKAHARAAYGYLGKADVDLGREAVTPRELSEPPKKSSRFVTLPLVVGRGPTFGVLQIEANATLNEPDLVFLNTVVNQLAIGLDRHAGDRALSFSEAKLAGIISIAKDAIISVDEDQRIRIFNEGAERIFAYAKADALGAPLDMLIPERLRASHRQHMATLAQMPAGPSGMPHLVAGLRKNGDEFPVEASISKLNLDGATVFTLAVRDVTAQRRHESSQKLLAEVGAVIATTLDDEAALNHIAQLATVKLADFCIIDVTGEDGAVGRRFVASRDPSKASICHSLRRLPRDGDRPRLSRIVFETNHSDLIRHVTPARLASFARSDEHLRVLRALDARSIVAAPLLAGGFMLGAVVLVSSTASQPYDEADVALAEEVARRASLTVMNARLHRATERAVLLRDEVLGIVAHDLRSPLGSILMAARMLRGEVRDLKRVEAIEQAATRMNVLIQDLLDVSLMEEGQLSVEKLRVAVEQIVATSVQAHAPRAAAASVELSAHVAPHLPEIWANPERLLQILQNLIGNALTFCEPGDRIIISAVPRDGEVLFSVADTGGGIAPEDLPRVFDRFWQARRTGKGGGLGLRIVKGLVESHGGRVWVASTPHEGSTFFFTIPAAGEPDPTL